MIRLIIVDDHALFIEGLRSLLEKENDLEVADSAHNGPELLSLLSRTRTDVMLLDINLPRTNGLEIATQVRRLYPSVRILMLSTYNDEHLVERSKAIGVNGYLLKTATREELVQAIRLVVAGHSCFPYQKPDPAGLLRDPFQKQFDLTKRELEILRMIGRGLTNQQVADQLFLSIYTVETHRKNIMQKLELKNAAALYRFIQENNL